MPATAASISDLLCTIRKLPPLPSGVARLLSLNQSEASFFETSCAIVRAEPELAYTYGLLHDVGRLVLVALYRNAASEVIEDNPHPVHDLVRREEEVFGVSHTLAGRLLGNKWKLPPQITVVVATHHIPRAERQGYPADLNRTID